jgi:hypothetical protein
LSSERIRFIDVARLGTMPLIYLLNRWVPQLVGKPKAAGPLIGPLVNAYLAPFEPQGKGSDCHVYPKV